MNTIGITGGTGLIGRQLSKMLIARGYAVTILSRHPRVSDQKAIKQVLFDAESEKCDSNALAQLTGVIHLAGEPVAGKRWTKAQKSKIFDSRVAGTKFLVDQLREHAPLCKTLVAASAIGYYGADKPGQSPFSEQDPNAEDFLGSTCRAWEAAANAAEGFSRVALLRTGIVLSGEGGAFKEFVRTLPLRVLPILSTGRQVISWIHIEDMASMYLYALENPDMHGPYNAVAPNPVSNQTLMKTIGQHHGGPHFYPRVPAVALRIALGEMSVEVLKSCTVSAEKIQSTGFRFRYSDIKSAVSSLI
ncbi:MAG: TIGR01777 family oxidoreductase [Taibaiella sp.]|nr:TIGR01777 family oxidoreductase [Taibaiella sp.]